MAIRYRIPFTTVSVRYRTSEKYKRKYITGQLKASNDRSNLDRDY